MRSAAATTDDDAQTAPIPAIDLDEILDADFIASLVRIAGGLELELGQLGLVTSINQSIDAMLDADFLTSWVESLEGASSSSGSSA